MLIILAILLQIVGFYGIYNGSEEAELRKDAFSLWLQRNSLFSQVAGLMLVINSFVLLLFELGIAAGVLTGAILLFTISSLVSLLSPLLNHINKNAGQ